MSYMLRYNIVANESIALTGNTFGLNKVAKESNQTNSAGGTVSTPVTLEVSTSGPVEGPITTDLGVRTTQEQPVSGIILASDLAGLPLMYQLVGFPALGSAELNPDGSFTYIPNPGFVGTDTFRVRVTDSLGYSALSTVSVVVYPEGEE